MQCLWVRSTQMAVRSTHKFCYIVRRHHFLVFKGQFFIQKHNKIVIQSETTKFFARSRRFGSSQYLKHKHWLWGGGLKLGNLTSKDNKANVFNNNCLCACSILSFYPLYANVSETLKMVVFVVKRYALREAKKCRYAVRNGGGVTLRTGSL